MRKKYIILLIIAAIIILLLTSSSVKPKINNITYKLPRNGNWGKRSLSGVTDITVHHSASGTNQTAWDFANYHIKNKGWAGIGYHFVINPKGEIFQTNELYTLSYHNGFNNIKAIGVCMVGNFEYYQPTEPQKDSLIWLSKYLKNKIPSIYRLIGHKEYAGQTACPGKYTNLNSLRLKTGLKGLQGGINKLIQDQITYNPNEADN